MRGYADRLREQGRPPLLMRVGLNTGEVVVRSIRKDDLHADYVPVGHSTNLAARMEQLAAPGSILVSEYTHKLTDGYFAFKDMGKTQVKGANEPLNVYEVTGAGPLRTRLQLSARRGLTRFVGRQNEMEQLQQALEQAKAGHGQIVGVMGEPGLGKSRLFYEFKLTAQSSSCLVLEALAVSHGQTSPYLPLIGLLKEYFQIEPEDDERQRQSKIMGHVLTLDRSLEETLPYVFALLGIEDEQSNLQQMDPQIRRQRTFEALKKLFLRESLNQPLLLIVEDLHWIDKETQGFLDTLSESVASANLLLLVNYRPEYKHEWGQQTYYTQLRLAPLGKADAEEFLTVLLGDPEGATGRSPLRDLKQLILEKTDGTPFFMEEVVQELMEQGTLVRTDVGAVLCDRPAKGAHTGTPLQIPTTVQGVLAARIDRLTPEEKALLQQLSVIGRQFPASLVKQVVSQAEIDLYRVLALLQEKEFLYEQPAFPESEYIFKHALTQDVAYGTVLQEQRKALHGKTAEAMEVIYAEKLDDHYSGLAHHYRQSENTEKAIEYLRLAGQQAIRQSANQEAAEHLTLALTLLDTLPGTLSRSRTELGLQISLGSALVSTQGWGSPALERASVRAAELCQEIGDSPALAAAGYGLWGIYLTRGELTQAAQIGEELFSQFGHENDVTLQLQAHMQLGITLYSLGEQVKARTHFDQCVALYDPKQKYLFDAAQFWGSSVTPSYGIGAITLHLLGYADQAEQRLARTMQIGQEFGDSQSTSYARWIASTIYHLRRDSTAAQEPTAALIKHSREYGFPLWLAWGTVLQGWARVQRGQGGDGLTQIREGLEMFRTLGQAWSLPYCYALLADSCSKEGEMEAGLQAVADGLAVVKKTEERCFEAELLRLKGECLVQQVSSKSPDAERAFQQSLRIASDQSVKALELRAATSLARLWQGQGKKDEARDLLAPVYNWFTEGFETADLMDAKALLESLS